MATSTSAWLCVKYFYGLHKFIEYPSHVTLHTCHQALQLLLHVSCCTWCLLKVIDKDVVLQTHLVCWSSQSSRGKGFVGRCWYLPFVGSVRGCLLGRLAHCSLRAGPDLFVDCYRKQVNKRLVQVSRHVDLSLTRSFLRCSSLKPSTNKRWRPIITLWWLSRNSSGLILVIWWSFFLTRLCHCSTVPLVLHLSASPCATVRSSMTWLHTRVMMNSQC